MLSTCQPLNLGVAIVPWCPPSCHTALCTVHELPSGSVDHGPNALSAYSFARTECRLVARLSRVADDIPRKLYEWPISEIGHGPTPRRGHLQPANQRTRTLPHASGMHRIDHVLQGDTIPGGAYNTKGERVQQNSKSNKLASGRQDCAFSRQINDSASTLSSPLYCFPPEATTRTPHYRVYGRSQGSNALTSEDEEVGANEEVAFARDVRIAPQYQQTCPQSAQGSV